MKKHFETKMVCLVILAVFLVFNSAHAAVILLNNWTEITDYTGNNNKPQHFYSNWHQNDYTDNAQFQVWPASWNGGNNIAVFRKSWEADVVYRVLTGPEMIGVDGTKTFFFRFIPEDEKANQSIGLTGVTIPSGENSFRVQLINRYGQFGVRHGSQDLLMDIDIDLDKNGTDNSLYNVWVVVDNAADTFKVYMNRNDLKAGLAGATESDRLEINDVNVFDFRTAQPAATSTLLIHAYDGLDFDGKVWYDDFYMMEGETLENPLLLQADMDGNGLVNFIDFWHFAQQWHTDGFFDPSADFDGSEWVDPNDLGRFSDEWLLTEDWYMP